MLNAPPSSMSTHLGSSIVPLYLRISGETYRGGEIPDIQLKLLLISRSSRTFVPYRDDEPNLENQVKTARD